MMFNSKKIAKLEDEILDLKRDLETRRAEINDLRSLLKGEQAKVRDEECVFDFKMMKAFSVERQWKWNDSGPVTIIGYIKPETQEIGEWHLYCNSLQHERLVAEFKKAMK
jgi:hypothetical protein